MIGTRSFMLGVMLLLAVPASAFAQDYTRNTPGLAGFDPVAYFTDGKPMRGSGNHVTIQDGVTYAFTTEEHKKMFEANPQKYLPAYGGYCAYGVAVGKKFVVDPEAWKIRGRETLFDHGQGHSKGMGKGRPRPHQEGRGQLVKNQGQRAR